MAACGNGKNINTEQAEQNEQDIIEERKAEIEEHGERVIVDNETVDKTKTITELAEPVENMTSYGLNMQSITDYGRSTNYNDMDIDEQKIWGILSNGHDMVTYDKVNRIYFISTDETGQVSEISSMLNMKETGDKFVEMYTEINSAMNGYDEGYTLVMLNPENLDNALFVITNGEVLYSVFDEM